MSEAIATIIDSIATLLWPVIVIIVLLYFRGAVSEVIRSTRQRGFSVKVAGNELTVQEANRQQQEQIADLQRQIIKLSEALEARESNDEVEDTGATDGSDELLLEKSVTAPERPPRAVKRILWVDDKPERNSYLMEELRELGVQVDVAQSTGDALRTMRPQTDCLITDLGRHEEGRYHAGAGLELITATRQMRPDLKIIVYSRPELIQVHHEQLVRAGAGDMLSSPTMLLKRLVADKI